MKKIVNFTLLLLFAALFFQCKDDDPILPPPPPPPPCLAGLDSVTVPAVNQDTINDFSQCVFSWIPFYPERYKYTFPSFNPNNAAEIAFVRWDREENKWHLCILNFCSGELRIVTDKGFLDVDWGKQGWIAFIGKDLQVWKVKPNGEDLTRLTNGGENINPVWNPEGDKIGYTRLSDNFFIIDTTGTVMDTVEKLQYKAAPNWSYDGNKFSFVQGSDNATYGPAYYDIITDEIHQVEIVGLYNNYIYQTEWSKDNNEIFWVAPQKIACTNIFTGIRTEIITMPDGVNNRRYIGFTISPDFKRIVTCREDWKQLNECDVEIRTNLYIMNIDGTDERKILIPE